MATNKDILIKELATHPNALKKFSLCLDRQFKHIPYWSHFAYKLKVDSDVIRQCEPQCPESSPTIKLFEFLQATKPELLIKDLLSALDAEQRIDIYTMIKGKGFKDEDKVSEVITCSSSDILDKIALELDSARKPVPNWKSLAKGLKVPYEVYQKFEMFSDYNPTVRLLRYLFTTRDTPILLKDLMDCFIGMGRKDVIHEIEKNVQSNDINTLLANDVLKVGSDLRQKIADLLNKDIPGVEGWQGFARHFHVDSSIIESLEGPHDMEVCSPTTRIINFMAAKKPSTTISDIIKALVKIKRYDAIKILRSYFKTDLSYDEEVEDLSVITNDSTNDSEAVSDTGTRFGIVDRIATTTPGTPKMTTFLPGTPKMTASLPGTPKMTASLPGTPKMTASLPGTPKMTASLPGTPKMTKFGIQATEQTKTQADAEQSLALCEEALLPLQEALAMQERVLDTPEETAKTSQELAVVLYQLGKNEESKKQMNKIAKCMKKIKIHDDLPCLPKSASPSVEAVGVESAVKRGDAASNQTNDSEACSSMRKEVKKILFAGVKEYFKQKLGLNSGETGASTQDGNNIDGYFEKYEKFALDYQHRVFVSDIKNIMKLELSIGAIITVNISNVKKFAGTCFRIGTRYVITNKHVIDIKDYDILLQKCYVDFNYQEQGSADLRFRFATSPVLVTSKELDYAILELHPDDKRKFPPSVIGSGFNIAPAGRKLKSEDCLTLIGHPAGNKKQIDVSCPIKDQDDLRQHLEHAQSKRSETDNQTGYESYLFCIEKASSHPHVATYDVSTFFHGSSGSPGFFLEEKLLVVLHAGYIPFEGTAKKNHVLEYGILMSSVVEDVKCKVPLSDIFDDSNAFTSSAESMDIDQVPG